MTKAVADPATEKPQAVPGKVNISLGAGKVNSYAGILHLETMPVLSGREENNRLMLAMAAFHFLETNRPMTANASLELRIGGNLVSNQEALRAFDAVLKRYKGLTARVLLHGIRRMKNGDFWQDYLSPCAAVSGFKDINGYLNSIGYKLQQITGARVRREKLK